MLCQAPPRSDVVQSLKNGIIVNLLGMGAAMLGMQATVGWLMAKSLTTSSNPFYQGVSPMSSPVLALDVFLVQVLLKFFSKPFSSILLVLYMNFKDSSRRQLYMTKASCIGFYHYMRLGALGS